MNFPVSISDGSLGCGLEHEAPEEITMLSRLTGDAKKVTHLSALLNEIGNLEYVDNIL